MSQSLRRSRAFLSVLASGYDDRFCSAISINPSVARSMRGLNLLIQKRQSRLSWIGAAMACLFVGSGLIFAALANDAETQVLPTLKFQIPEQSLVTALQAYSSTSGVAVLYESSVVSGQRSAVVDGEYTREAALKVLLGKTDLVARYARADAITLADPSAASPDHPPEFSLGPTDMALETLHVASATTVPDRNALADYIGIIQKDIQLALKKVTATRNGAYRVGLDLWVDPSRTVRRTEIFRSTGNPERDVAISAALQGLTFRQPAPARTPQPVRVMIDIRAM